MTLKGSGVESFSCIIKISESIIIQPADGPIQEQTHKKYSVTRIIKSKQLLKIIVQNGLSHSHRLHNLKTHQN